MVIVELVVKFYPERKQLNFQQYKIILPAYPSCQIIIGLCLIKINFDQNMKLNLLNRNIKLVKNYLGEILIFLLDYHMQTKRLEKFKMRWLMLNITHHKI